MKLRGGMWGGEGGVQGEHMYSNSVLQIIKYKHQG